MVKKIINLNVDLKSLDGKPLIGENNIGKIIGQMLAFDTKNKGDFYKFFEWGRALYNGETITLDKSDYEKLKKFIEESDLPHITKAQALPLLENDKQSDQSDN